MISGDLEGRPVGLGLWEHIFDTYLNLGSILVYNQDLVTTVQYNTCSTYEEASFISFILHPSSPFKVTNRQELKEVMRSHLSPRRPAAPLLHRDPSSLHIVGYGTHCLLHIHGLIGHHIHPPSSLSLSSSLSSFSVIHFYCTYRLHEERKRETLLRGLPDRPIGAYPGKQGERGYTNNSNSLSTDSHRWSLGDDGFCQCHKALASRRPWPVLGVLQHKCMH
jgi:hypothetical protein